MRFLPPLLCCLCLLAARANAASPYANQYVALTYDADAELVGAANIVVRDDGSIAGREVYFDSTNVDFSGTVDDAGQVTLDAYPDGDDPFEITTHFRANGKKLVVHFPNGDVLRAKRVFSNFTQAGIYYLGLDTGEDGLVLLTRNGTLLGYGYDDDGNLTELDGTADADGFSATSADGVDYEGVIDGYDIYGTYSDGASFGGTFSGLKY